LRIEVDYQSEVSRTKRKKVSGFLFHSYVPKKSQFPEVLLIAQFPPILFLEELNIGTVKYLTTISGAFGLRGHQVFYQPRREKTI
jgi:hypothetical protein